MRLVLTASAAAIASRAGALDNGVGRLPVMGWSSWYGYTSQISEQLIMEVGGAAAPPRREGGGC